MPSLRPHPDSPSGPACAIDVDVARAPGGLVRLTYVVTGRIADLVIPPPAPPVRADGLWKHTCFELFVRRGGEAYGEINLSPSGAWAAYALRAVRERAADPEITSPQIAVDVGDDRLELRATLALGPLAPAGDWRVGLSAVLEAKDGVRSYWALAHPPGLPDFHDPAAHALDLPAPDLSHLERP